MFTAFVCVVLQISNEFYGVSMLQICSVTCVDFIVQTGVLNEFVWINES